MAESYAEESAASSMKKLDLVGYLSRDTFGRVYIDTCATNEQHLLNRHGCRKYIEDLVPEKFVGKKVFLAVTVYVEDEKESS